MARLIRSRQAKEDLLAIAGHIATDNPLAAAKWLEQIERTLN